MITDALAARQKGLTRVVIAVSLLIPVVVAILLFMTPPQVTSDFDFTVLPRLHAVFNSLTAVLLVLSFFFIRAKNITAHKTANLFALLLSVLFLVSYVVYHTFTESTPYGGEGNIRYLYYFILITHIILAVVIVPLVLFTFMRALFGDFEKHRKIAKWTLPLWLYVAVTGVIVYVMISPYYGN